MTTPIGCERHSDGADAIESESLIQHGCEQVLRIIRGFERTCTLLGYRFTHSSRLHFFMWLLGSMLVHHHAFSCRFR